MRAKIARTTGVPIRAYPRLPASSHPRQYTYLPITTQEREGHDNLPTLRASPPLTAMYSRHHQFYPVRSSDTIAVFGFRVQRARGREHRGRAVPGLAEHQQLHVGHERLHRNAVAVIAQFFGHQQRKHEVSSSRGGARGGVCAPIKRACDRPGNKPRKKNPGKPGGFAYPSR